MKTTTCIATLLQNKSKALIPSVSMATVDANHRKFTTDGKLYQTGIWKKFIGSLLKSSTSQPLVYIG